MIDAWIRFLGDKREEEVTLKGAETGVLDHYDQFYKVFSELKARPLTASLRKMPISEENRNKLGNFLIQALCDKYQRNYDPHYVTGMGAILWVQEQYSMDTQVATNALYQYLDFFFSGLR